MAEKLALAYWKLKGLPVVVFRFWWSYGKTIGGRHLRDMITLAQTGQPLTVPEGAGGSFLDHDDLAHALLLAKAGGSFLDHDDLAHALLLAVQEQASIGQIFNLATVYLE